MDADLIAGLCLFLALVGVVALSIFMGQLHHLRSQQGRHPMYAQYWAEQVWWCRFGMGLASGVATGAFIALLVWG